MNFQQVKYKKIRQKHHFLLFFLHIKKDLQHKTKRGHCHGLSCDLTPKWILNRFN